MDRATRARIESLLHEVRSWAPGQVQSTIEELARRYQLDPLMVHRLLETEGVETEETLELEGDEDVPDGGRRVTTVLTEQEIAAARKAAGLDDD
jgi:hypothetical protein